MPVTTPEQFQAMLSAAEGTRLEFKEAKGTYSLEDLANYCVALANEGGGKMVLKVTDKRPRSVVGTQAFEEPGIAEYQLHQVLHHRIPVEEYLHEGCRAVIVHVPSRLPGTAWHYKGAYKKRAGQALVAMGEAELKTIFAETGPDFTAEIVPRARYADLQPEAVTEFRNRWQRKSGNPRLATMTDEQILQDCSLIEGDGITYAALLLLGRPSAINRHLAQAEVIFEYRSAESAGPAADREEFREPFLLFHDRLWTKINLRNDRCGFIERSGQGVNLMIERAVRQTKPLPDFSRSAAHEVFLTLSGTVKNPAFLRFIERLGEDALSRFQTLDFLALDALTHGRELTPEMKTRLPDLIEAGAVESQGRGKGRRSFLSRELYEVMGTPGVHTRQRGLDYETNKALLLKHLISCRTGEAPIKDLEQVLPAQSRASILRMLNELRDEGRIKLHRAARASLWKLIQLLPSETIPEAILKNYTDNQ